MKFFIFIFSIYLSALSVVPCSDALIPVKNSISHTSVPLSDPHQEDHSDLCSPFCVCNCCGSIALEFQLKTYTLKVDSDTSEFYKIIPARKTSIISYYNGSIWQPPKIAA